MKRIAVTNGMTEDIQRARGHIGCSGMLMLCINIRGAVLLSFFCVHFILLNNELLDRAILELSTVGILIMFLCVCESLCFISQYSILD